MQPLYEVDGSEQGLKAARDAIAKAKERGGRVVFQGVVRDSWFSAPQPAIGEKIRKFQRVEFQLLRLADEAKAAGVDYEVVLPGHAPAGVAEPERVALRPAAA